MDLTKFPPVMANANIDLASTASGKFSPGDWERILDRAQAQWLENQRSMDEATAWQTVVRDFHVQRYWGFRPNYRAPRAAKKKTNLGFQLIWLMFGSFTVMKVAVLWFGQIYSRSDESVDKWAFFAVLTFVIGNILWFLWRNRNYQD